MVLPHMLHLLRSSISFIFLPIRPKSNSLTILMAFGWQTRSHPIQAVHFECSNCNVSLPLTFSIFSASGTHAFAHEPHMLHLVWSTIALKNDSLSCFSAGLFSS